MDKLEQALDKNIELATILEQRLNEFKKLLDKVLIGEMVLVGIQFIMILWLVLN